MRPRDIWGRDYHGDAMRELRVQVPGHVGGPLTFTTCEAVFEAYPHRASESNRMICQRARAWLTPGVERLMGSTEPHCLVVESA